MAQTTIDICERCNGTGWMKVTIKRGGYEGEAMQRCVCRTRARAEREKEKPGGFASIESIGFGNVIPEAQSAAVEGLPNPDRVIGGIILAHRGKEQAISIEDICVRMWPSEWYGGGSEDAAELHKRRSQMQRAVKASVERIRREAHLPVASCKGNPAGYYIPVTAAECDECYQRLFGEGVKLILLARLFRPEADIAAELRGQLRITSSEL